MSAAETREVYHYKRRADGSVSTYVERRPCTRKYRLKLPPAEGALALSDLRAGLSFEEAAAKYNMPLTSFQKAVLPLLLEAVRG